MRTSKIGEKSRKIKGVNQQNLLHLSYKYVGWDLSSSTFFVKDQMSVTQKLKSIS